MDIREIYAMGRIATEAKKVAILPTGEEYDSVFSAFRKTLKRFYETFLSWDKTQEIVAWFIKMFNKDGWFEAKLFKLYDVPFALRNVVNRYSWVRIREGDRVIERKYKFRNIDLFEMMTIDKLAHDEKARKFFTEEFIDLIKKAKVEVDGKLVTVKEYAEMKGLKWEDVEERIREKVNSFFEFYKRKMEEYEKGGDRKRGLFIEGDRLAYYLYIREEAMSDDIWSKLLMVASDSIGHTAALSIISRNLSVLEPTFTEFTKGEKLGEKSILASFIGINPSKEVEKVLKYGDWESVEYFRDKLEKEIQKATPHVLVRRRVMSMFKVNVPIINLDSVSESNRSRQNQSQRSREIQRRELGVTT